MTKLFAVGSFVVTFLLVSPVFSDSGFTTGNSSLAGPLAALSALSGGLSTCQPKPEMKVTSLKQLQSLAGCSASDSYSRVKSFFDHAIVKAGGSGSGSSALSGAAPVPSFETGSNQ